jgi:hypothetical protein
MVTENSFFEMDETGTSINNISAAGYYTQISGTTAEDFPQISGESSCLF